MQYGPPIQTNAGNIIASAANNASEIYAQGMQNFGQSIGSAMQSIGEGYAKSVAKAQENKMTSEYLDQMASFYAQTPGPDGKTPLMSAEDLEKFSKASLGAKQGMIVPRQAQFDQILKNSYLQAQMGSYLSRINQQAATQAALRQPAPNQTIPDTSSVTIPADMSMPESNLPFNFNRNIKRTSVLPR